MFTTTIAAFRLSWHIILLPSTYTLHSHGLFTPLPSRRRGQYSCIKAGTERLKNRVETAGPGQGSMSVETGKKNNSTSIPSKDGCIFEFAVEWPAPSPFSEHQSAPPK
jgi:hypothetical protein